jgi:hypothetical protein
VSRADLPPPAADAPLDGSDLSILGGVRDLFEHADPMPADLVDNVLFAVSLADLDVELCRLTELSGLAAAGTRDDDGEQSRTVTFDSDSLTIMVTLIPLDENLVRLDGWLAPPAACRVELRTPAGSSVTTSDGDGRFVLDRVSRGLAKLVIRRTPADPAARAKEVVTPSIEL